MTNIRPRHSPLQMHVHSPVPLVSGLWYDLGRDPEEHFAEPIGRRPQPLQRRSSLWGEGGSGGSVEIRVRRPVNGCPALSDHRDSGSCAHCANSGPGHRTRRHSTTPTPTPTPGRQCGPWRLQTAGLARARTRRSPEMLRFAGTTLSPGTPWSLRSTGTLRSPRTLRSPEKPCSPGIAWRLGAAARPGITVRVGVARRPGRLLRSRLSSSSGRPVGARLGTWPGFPTAAERQPAPDRTGGRTTASITSGSRRHGTGEEVA